MTQLLTPGEVASPSGARLIDLVENGPAVQATLMPDDAEALNASNLVTLTPTTLRDVWSVASGRFVGVARIRGIELRIQPKLPIRRLLFLLGYAYDLRAWREEQVAVAPDRDLVSAMATAFVRAAARAIEQGLLQGYRATEEATPVLRGRIRTDEQLRCRFGLVVPLEIRYDDYTVDIAENRILRSAADRLLRLPGVHSATRHELLRLGRTLTDVQPLARGTLIPAWQPTRLNARYQPALRLGELVLRGGSVEQGEGRHLIDGFMLDMPVVFEQFVTQALRAALAPLGGRLAAQPTYHLDEGREVTLRPDIVWYAETGGAPTAVADAKYKAEKPSGYPNADIYQMLAYCTRLHLGEGHLIYAQGETTTGHHRVVGAPITIVRHALDLARAPQALLKQVGGIAGEITRR